ncbi:MAG: Nif3-like dinuclear metal center hexameric protein [Verrucomicrobia bacterium]|nr:Nif3-like dinuclear metal center hexameric protein [Verrucomicrobiota bacterium]
MPFVTLSAIVKECNRLLKPERFNDWDGAVNGLQVENRGKVHRIAAAVDATLSTVQSAVQVHANLLLVHHGLFWSPSYPWTGSRYRLLRLLLDNDLAVYSAHLPLDAHPRLGNSAGLCAALGLGRVQPFFECRGHLLGFKAATRLSRDVLAERLEKATGARVTLLPGGPSICRRIGVVTGSAGAELAQAALEGVDTFITGEGPHWTFGAAEFAGINVMYAGHYATETFGVKALARHLSQKFRVPWVFIDNPSGL